MSFSVKPRKRRGGGRGGGGVTTDIIEDMHDIHQCLKLWSMPSHNFQIVIFPRVLFTSIQNLKSKA